MKSRFLPAALLASLMLVSLPGFASGDGLNTLRGAPIQGSETESNDAFKMSKESAPIPRDYVQQPPLVPHKVEGYAITKNFNKCMDCHSWTRYKESGATKVSLTHFKTRDGQELSNISPRRYFCLQCHVPQADAKPLVGNTFQRAQGLQ
ncbi:nitrate reductase cytochrome c-type subunit [Azovibrio restrictus]|uniref:nitrate reductase cytochrome c-type subunit n=1 Tax=Azovibrio restrictus TaxID=146938 RepID=UPI000421DD78|nr:nitrate reductase cytochrome c-type subunit [Azovibrio restrictus]